MGKNKKMIYNIMKIFLLIILLLGLVMSRLEILDVKGSQFMFSALFAFIQLVEAVKYTMQKKNIAILFYAFSFVFFVISISFILY